MLKMEKGIPFTSFLLLLLVSLVLHSHVSFAQVPIPAKFDGFVYKGNLPKEDSVVIEAFFDPLCPYSRDSWPPLKKTFQHYYPRVSINVHVFPLPYHDNAFLASRALTIADKLNSSSTFPLLEEFFKHQEKFYGDATRNFTRRSTTTRVARFASYAVGENSIPKVRAGFEDFNTNMATRISFKYGCSRGVMGTPSFFVNGFPSTDGQMPQTLDQWKDVIDPLVNIGRRNR